MYKVYAKLDTNNCIVGIESTAFYDEQKLTDKGYIFIDEGFNGDMYGHAQPNYLRMKYGKTTYDEQFHPNFKYIDGNVIELTDEEKELLFPPIEPQPTEQDLINADIYMQLAQLQMGGMMNG